MGWFWKRFRVERGKIVLARDIEKEGHGMPLRVLGYMAVLASKIVS
jgi:hypothetical protein